MALLFPWKMMEFPEPVGAPVHHTAAVVTKLVPIIFLIKGVIGLITIRPTVSLYGEGREHFVPYPVPTVSDLKNSRPDRREEKGGYFE